MAENLDIHSAKDKPTLSTPSTMGKNIDKKFGGEFNKVGLNVKNMSEEAEEKKSEVGSLKKKIFNLAKAETTIMQDEYLSGIYNKMKEGAREKFGYHWNEVIVNLIFNDHILDNANYLQKYKNTTAYDKKRRGEEGVAELEKNVQDKVIASKQGSDASDFGRTEKVSDVAKEKIKSDKIINKTDSEDDGHIDGSVGKNDVNEINLNPFASKPAPLTTHIPNENDTYIVDKKSNTAVAVLSPNDPIEKRTETSNKYPDTVRYVRMSLDSATQNGVKNMPQIPNQTSNTGNKYTTQSYSNMPSYGAVKEEGVAETTGAAGAGSFAPALDINETTSTAGPGGGSSGTGQYSGPSAWAKNTKNQRFAHAPAWKGGEILQEAVKTGNYLTDPEAFKKYVRLTEGIISIQKIMNECECNVMDEAESVKQDALNILKKIKDNKTNNPELANMPEIKTLEDAWNEVARTGSYDAIIALKDQPKQMDEHHLEDRESKIQFILNKTYNDGGDEANYTEDQLSQMSDDEINNLYLSTEKEMGVNELTSQAKFNAFSKSKDDMEQSSKNPLKYTRRRDQAEKFGSHINPEIINEFNKIGQMIGMTVELTKTVHDNYGEYRPRGYAVFRDQEGKEILSISIEPNEYSFIKNTPPKSINRQLERAITNFQKTELNVDKADHNYVPASTKPVQAPQPEPVQSEPVAAPAKKSFMDKVKGAFTNESPDFEAAIKTDLEDGQGVDTSNMSLDQAEGEDGLFKDKWNMNEESPALSIDGLTDWAGKNILHATTDPSQLIQDFAQQNNVSVQQLRDKAKMYATNAGLGLIPNAAEVKDVLMDLVAQIDEMLGTIPKQNVMRKPEVDEKAVSKNQQQFMGMVHAAQKGELENPSPEVAKAAAGMSDKAATDFASTKHKGLPTTVKEDSDVDNQAHFGDLKTKGLRKKIRVSELLALAQTQPDLAQIQEFASSKGIAVERLIELADQYLRNNLGYDDYIETPEQGALVDLIDAASQEGNDVVSNDVEDDTMDMPEPSDDIQDEPIAEEEQSGGDETTVLAELGKILFPFYTDLPVEQMVAKVQDFLNSDQRSRGKDPKQILNLMKSKLGSMGMVESMIDDQPDSMINVSDTSMAMSSDSPELNTTGSGSDSMSMGTDSSSSIDDIKMNEAKPYAGKGFKEKTFKAKEKQEVKKEIKKELENRPNMNEEKKTPSMLNLDSIKKQNAAIANKEMASADALKQAKTYPDSENFYIEQDDKKVQEFQTAEELEKAALAKIKPKDEGLQNVGDSTAGDNHIPKRNLTKEEMTKLAMERGDGMHNIVYDNEPSKKFEDRLKRDMGDDQYKLRQDKMKEKQDMPMYNKDTQPTEAGDDAKQFDKFKNGFNESYMGKYVDDFGKSQFIEFQISEVKEVATINEGFKLNLDGLGNKYTQKVNENKDFQNITNDFEYYILEDLKTVVRTKNDKSLNESAIVGKSVNEGVDKMARLMNYNTNDFVNTKKSVKF